MRAAFAVGVRLPMNGEPLLDRAGEDGKQQEQGLDPPGGRTLRQQPLLDARGRTRCFRRHERKASTASSGRTGSSGSASLSSRRPAKYVANELAAALDVFGWRLGVRPHRRMSEPWPRGRVQTRPTSGRAEPRRRQPRRCSTARPAAPDSPAPRRHSRRCRARAGPAVPDRGDAKPPVARQAIGQHPPVARLEDVERQRSPGKQHDRRVERWAAGRA